VEFRKPDGANIVAAGSRISSRRALDITKTVLNPPRTSAASSSLACGLVSDPNWAEQVTAIATAVGAIGLLSTLVAALFAARQVREARLSTQAQVAVDFLRRWDEPELVETRRLVAQYRSPEALRDAFEGYIASNSVDAYVLYRELDYFEQLGALEALGAVHLDLVQMLLGRGLVERWEMWKPSIDMMGKDVYPMFEALATKMRRELSRARSEST
jgi:hypothetical protein